MSAPLSSIVGPLLIQCHEAALPIFREIHGLQPGDLLLCIPGVAGTGVRLRAEDRRGLAAAIAPPGVVLAQGEPLTEREARNALLSLQRILECDDHGCTLCPDCQARARGEG